jgi:metal-responsive CopG/Arc/MetJ family transcriptional regulator
MRETITISLPRVIKQKLDELTRREHLNRSDVIREALRQYFARQEFRRLRGLMVPEAERRGIYTDEDVFRRFEKERDRRNRTTSP